MTPNQGDCPELLAAMAWDAARGAMELHGSYESVCFADPVISTVILSLGGWPQCCWDFTNSDSKGQIFYAREFQRLYSLYRKRVGRKPVTLLGRCDNENAIGGHLNTETFMLRLPGGGEKRIRINMVGFDNKNNTAKRDSGRVSVGYGSR